MGLEGKVGDEEMRDGEREVREEAGISGAKRLSEAWREV